MTALVKNTKLDKIKNQDIIRTQLGEINVDNPICNCQKEWRKRVTRMPTCGLLIHTLFYRTDGTRYLERPGRPGRRFTAQQASNNNNNN